MALKLLIFPLALLTGLFSANAALHVHAYNEGRDKAAQSIYSTLTNLNLTSQIAAMRTNLNYLATDELRALDERNALIRDFQLMAVLNSTGKIGENLAQRIDEGLKQVCGSTDTNLYSSYASAAVNFREKLKAVKSEADAFKLEIGIEPPAFSYVTNVPASPPSYLTNNLRADVEIATVIDDYRRYRIASDTAWMELVNLQQARGLLGVAQNELAVAVEEQARLKNQSEEKIAAYKKALSDYADAVKQGTNGAFPFNNLSNMLHKAATGLKSANNFLVNQFGIEQELQATRALILAAASETNSTPTTNAQLKVYVAIASGVPAINQAAAQLNTAIRTPPTAHLLLKKQLLEIQKQYLTKLSELQNQRILILQTKVEAVMQELSLLTLARNAANQTMAQFGTNANSATMPEVFKGTNAYAKRLMFDSITKFTTATRVARLRRDSADYKLIQLDYLEANLASESALQMWNSLIAIPVSQLVAYHGAGFKPEQVADIVVKGLGLGAIAWRLK